MVGESEFKSEDLCNGFDPLCEGRVKDSFSSVPPEAPSDTPRGICDSPCDRLEQQQRLEVAQKTSQGVWGCNKA